MLVKNKKNKKGFLLLEVLLALIILSCGIIAVIKTFSISLTAQRHNQFHTSAYFLANSIHKQIENALIENLEGKKTIGTGTFKWLIEIEPAYTEQLKLATVKVFWKERSRDYEISLATLYLKEFIEESFGY